MADSIRRNLQLLAPVAIRALLDDLLATFASQRDFAVETRHHLNPNVATRILTGEPMGAGITNPW